MGGYSERPRREPLTVPFIEGLHAQAEAARKRRRHQATCQGCESCDTAAEAKAEARAEL